MSQNGNDDATFAFLFAAISFVVIIWLIPSGEDRAPVNETSVSETNYTNTTGDVNDSRENSSRIGKSFSWGETSLLHVLW